MTAEAVPQSRLEREDLESLMRRYQCADEGAAAELIRRLSPPLFRFLSGPMATRGHAEDLLQECWLRIHKARHTYRAGDPVLPWVFAIARHARVDGFRRRSRIEWHELEIDQFPEQAAQADAPGDVAHIDLLRLLETLPDGQREVLFLLKVVGMSLEEVARATSATVGAVKQKAHRAYEKLREALEASGYVSQK